MKAINCIQFTRFGQADNPEQALYFTHLTQIPIHVPRIGELIVLPDDSGRVEDVTYDYVNGKVVVHLL